MVAIIQSALDDAYSQVAFMDFSGGRNTEKNIFNLELNESPDCLNVKFRPGRLLGRGGYVALLNSLPADPDGTAFFYDSGGNRRLVVWSGNNLYQVTYGIPTLIAAGVYVAGNPVANTTYNGVIYYSEGITPIRQYDPITGIEQGVPNSGAPFSVPPPAAKVLMTYNGCIVAGATTVGGLFEADIIRWCNVNDPTTWLALALQAVGQGTGGEINSLNNMGVSDQGVSPFKSIFVGKSKNGVFGLQGALGSLSEFLVPADCGVLDGRTVKFIAGPDGRAYVFWLGTDREVWFSNGISADKVSGQIRSELAQAILNQIQTVAKPRFTAVKNTIDYQYCIDIGDGSFFVYDYMLKAWTKYQGWPSGYWCEGFDVTGFPAIYVASGTSFSQANYGDTDNGALITCRWRTGLLNGGNKSALKEWDWLYVAFATDTGQMEVTAQSLAEATGNGLSSTGLLTIPAATGASPFILDASLLDGVDVLTAGYNSAFTIYQKKVRLSVPATNYPGIYDKLRGGNVQITFQQSLVQGHFELLASTLLFLKRGYKRVG